MTHAAGDRRLLHGRRRGSFGRSLRKAVAPKAKPIRAMFTVLAQWEQSYNKRQFGKLIVYPSSLFTGRP
jgi:hypothetical protein